MTVPLRISASEVSELPSRHLDIPRKGVSFEFNQDMVLLAVDGDRQTKVTAAPVAQPGFVLDLHALNRESFTECCAEVIEELFGDVAFQKHGATSVDEVLYSVLTRLSR